MKARPPLISVIAAAGFVLFALLMPFERNPGMDSTCFRQAAVALLNGQSLYDPLGTPPPWDELPFVFPPIAAIMFLPLAAMSKQLAWGVVAGLSIIGLGVVIRLTLRHLGTDRTWIVNAAAAGAFVLQPIWSTVGLGQVNLFLMILVVIDVLGLRGSKYGGMLVGVAGSLKLTPLIFIPYLWLTGRRADAGRAAATFAGMQAIGYVLLPADTVRFWTFGLSNGTSHRIHEAENQSLFGFITRLTREAAYAKTIWVVAAFVCVVLALVLVRRLHHPDRPVPALVVTGVCGLLISPISWTHHWIWIVPLVAVLAHQPNLRRWTVPLVIVCFSGTLRLFVPTEGRFELTWNWWQMLLGSSYTVVAVVAGLAALTDRTPGGSRKRTPAWRPNPAIHIPKQREVRDSEVMSAAYYWCLEHHRVETDEDKCPAVSVLGPYKSRSEAGTALQRIEHRNSMLDEEDKKWESGKP